MLVHGKCSNCSRQIILWSTSGKCHFLQHYKTLVGSRNIKNINLGHHSFHQLLSYLHWCILVVALFFYFSRWEERTHQQPLHRVKISRYKYMHCQKTISVELIFLGSRKQEKVIQVSQHCPFMLATALTACIPDAFAIAPADREGITGAAVWQSCDWDKVI